MKDFFTNWNYKKHAKLVAAVYLSCFAIDMTVGYVVMKKCVDKIDEKR